MALPASYTRRLLETVPPWLTRVVGEKLLRSCGDTLDGLARRVTHAVRQRFPNDIDETSLARIGRERRIRRGPGEAADAYASRLRIWWDMHRIRGGPYALLWNLHYFFLSWLPGRKDVLDHSGKVTWVDEDGVITPSFVDWIADGTDKRAQVWVVFYVPDLIPLPALLVTELEEMIVTMEGEAITVTTAIDPSALTAGEQEIFKAIPREWSAAHVWKTHIVLLWGLGRLWEYPDPTLEWATWDERDADVGSMTWDEWDAEMPTPFTITNEGL